MPELGQTSNNLNFEEIRAVADSKSLNFRFSNNETFKKFEPKGNISQKTLQNFRKKLDAKK